MLTADYTGQFKRDYKQAIKRNWDIPLLDGIICDLIEEKTLPPKNRDHSLEGKYKNCRECHVKPDWLLIYQVGNGVIVFERTGTHSELF